MTSQDALFKKRHTLEALAVKTPGVVGIAEGISNSGSPCIKVLLIDKVDKDKLPSVFRDPDVELEYVGTPDAQ